MELKLSLDCSPEEAAKLQWAMVHKDYQEIDETVTFMKDLPNRTPDAIVRDRVQGKRKVFFLS